MIVRCSKCNEYVLVQKNYSYEKLSNGRGPSILYSFLSCRECNSVILIQQTNQGNMAEGDIWGRPLILFPSDVSINTSAPLKILQGLEESHSCYHAQAYTASAIMCRKTLELICDEFKIKEKTLSKSLNKMHTLEIIDQRLLDWSHELRLRGNEAAHGIDFINQNDAKDIIEFTNAILEYIFLYRDRFEKFKKRRLKP